MASRKSPDQNLRLFQSNVLEKLTVIPVGAFVVIWAALFTAAVWSAWGSARGPVAAMLVIGGWLIWLLIEYAMHRYLFHFEPNSDAGRKFAFVIHGNHHAAPNDPLRNLMPPVVSLPLAAILWWLSFSVLGPKGAWLLVGIMAGYIVYDLTHYACHQWPMKGRIAAAIKRHHMRHHHLDTAGNYAITGVFLDHLFGTVAKPPQRKA